MRDEAGPDWVRDALHQALDEVRAFLRTAIDFTLHPRRFAVEWAAGQRRALNPLGFLATAFAVFGLTRALLGALLHEKEDQQSLLLAGLGTLLPFGYYLVLGTIQHGVLRLFGSRRPLRDTCALVLYTGGGPATAANVLVYGMAIGLFLVTREHEAGSSLPVVIGACIAFGVYWTTLSTAVAALHHTSGIRWWHIAIANTIAILTAGALFAIFDPPGDYGLHVVIGPSHSRGHWHFMAALRG